jgi:hypothetical protein
LRVGLGEDFKPCWFPVTWHKQRSRFVAHVGCLNRRKEGESKVLEMAELVVHKLFLNQY